MLDDLVADLAQTTGAALAALCVVELEEEWIAACAGCDHVVPVPGPDDDIGGALSQTAATEVDLVDITGEAPREQFTIVLDPDHPASPAERTLVRRGIRAVAGARIVLSDGVSIGAVCVASNDPVLLGETVVYETARAARAVAARIEWLTAQRERQRQRLPA